MKLKIKVITIAIILLIITSNIIFTSANVVFAADENVNLYSKGVYSNLLRYGGANIEFNFVVYSKDGVEYPAYCLDVNLPGVTGSQPYSVSVTGLVTNAMVWRAIVNGYPYKSAAELGCDTNEQAFLATKQAVYCILYNRDPNTYTAMNAGGEKCLNALINIVTTARSSGETKLSSNLSVIADSAKWELDRIDGKYVSMTYKANSAGLMSKYKVELEGELPEGTLLTDESNNPKNEFATDERFKVLIPITNLLKDGNFNINVSGQTSTKPVLYGKAPNSGLQDYALSAYVFEDGSGTQKIYYTENSTKIIILKQERDNDTPLAGVHFELLDQNQNVIHTSLVTDELGQITIQNLLPGKYYIKEIKTLEGLILYDKFIVVELDLNEEATVIVRNGEEEVNFQSEKSSSSKEVENKVSTTTVRLPKTGM